MAENKISLRLGGPAGTGIMNTGLVFAKCCSRIGLHVFDYIEYPSLIRGGHNTYHVRAEDRPVYSQIRIVDILIALDEESLTLHKDELKEDSFVFYDEKSVNPDRAGLKRGIRCPLPLKEIVTAAGGDEIMQNTVALAAALGVMSYPFPVFQQIIEESFKGKPSEVAAKNVEVARHGYEHARQEYGHLSHYKLSPVKAPERMIVSGNEAVALGAIAAGLHFFAAYPMTPASNVLHTLAALQEKHDYVVKHAEDEISAVNMVIGAGYAGCRSMTATSGGGFALMNEGVSLAGITETPIVINEVMRGGPATGLPTWTGQDDLQWVLHAGHGEFLRIVLAPSDIEESFWMAAEAFNLAEKYQTPVLLITDKYLAESHKSVPVFDTSKVKIDRGKLLRKAPENFRRYQDTADGISPRTIPGVKNGLFLANSDEHDEYGWSTEEIAMRNKMVEKRARKQKALEAEMPQPRLIGLEHAELTFVTWGSNKGPILEAMRWLEKEGVKTNLLQITWLNPFPAATVTKLLQNAKRTLLVECNHDGQLGNVIREKTGILLTERLLKYDGRPFYPEEVYERAKKVIGGGR